MTLKKLDNNDIFTILCQTLPEQNNFFEANYLKELHTTLYL